MSHPPDISDCNYFDVEDFSVDLFFRSLELQSRFTSSDLEFTFPADLENVPITSVGFLDSCTTAKSLEVTSEVSAAEDGDGCCSSLVESEKEKPVTEDGDGDDDSDAVASFFHSLQLRSCLLRADEETVNAAHDKTISNNNVRDGLYTHSQFIDIGSPSRAEGNVYHMHKRDDISESDSGTHLPKKSASTDYLSAWSSFSATNERECRNADREWFSTQNHKVSVTASSYTPDRTDNFVTNSESLCDLTAGHKNDSLCRPEQAVVNSKDDICTANSTARHVLKGGKLNCNICGIELSNKYSYVRHLTTPLHLRRAEGFCNTKPPVFITPNNISDDVIHLISKQKPVQCRICHFFGETSPQLLHHLTSHSHFDRVKRKLLRCLPCRFVGTCDDIVTHVKSESHINLVSRVNQPCVITTYRSRGNDSEKLAYLYQTKEKSRLCTDCGAKFSSASSLEIHVRRKHTGLRPFVCVLCDKAYCDKSTLRLHYRTAQHRQKSAQ